MESLLGDAAKGEEKALYTMGCRVLETTTMEFFLPHMVGGLVIDFLLFDLVLWMCRTFVLVTLISFQTVSWL